MPPGVFVDSVNKVICAAENPRSSRRNSFWNWAAGATNSATRKPDTASSQTRLGRGPVGARSRAASNRWLSGRRRATASVTGTPASGMR